MTSYVAIPNGDIDQDSPITQPLMTALRDNPIAIAEGDASVPAGLFPTVLLGTIATTSGSTVTLSGLTLTPYKYLIFEFRGVNTSGSGTRGIAGQDFSSLGAGATNGLVFVMLASGRGWGALGGSIASDIYIRSVGYSTATTSVSITTSAIFSAGSVDVYGVK